MTYRLYVLKNSFIILLHLVQLVSVVLRDFCDNIRWELGLVSNIFSINEKSLLEKWVYLNVIFHLIQLAQNHLVVRVNCQVVNRIFFDLHLQNLGMWSGPITCDSVLQIIDLKLAGCFFVSLLRTRPSWFKVNWNYVISEVADALFLIFLNMVDWCFLSKSKKSDQMSFFALVFLTCCHRQRVSNVVEICASSLQIKSLLSGRLVLHFNLGINMFFNSRIVDYASLEQEIHINLVVFRCCLLFEQKQVDNVPHLLTLLNFESSLRLTSRFIRDQISARLIVKSIKHYFTCSIF